MGGEGGVQRAGWLADSAALAEGESHTQLARNAGPDAKPWNADRWLAGWLVGWLAGPPHSRAWYRLLPRVLGSTFAPEASRGGEHLRLGSPSGGRIALSRAHTASHARTHARTNGTNLVSRFPRGTHPLNLR